MIEPFIIDGDEVVVAAFDAKAYLWRDQLTGRELSADEVEQLGHDAGLRDSPETDLNVRRYVTHYWCDDDTLRWYDRQRLLSDEEAEELGLHIDLTKEGSQ